MSSEMPGALRFLTNKKIFYAMGIVFAAGIALSVFGGILFDGSGTAEGPTQANEAADIPRDQAEASPTADPSSATPTPVIRRYSAAPEMTIDTSKRYVATVKTSQGDIQIELDPSASPEAVNSFVFLAKEGYYNGTPFMQVNAEANFTAQAGDPTQTGLGTPGYSINERPTSKPFVRGAVGYSSGQFYISYGDYPALTGKETIIGQVTSGLDVLDRLQLLNVRQKTGTPDKVESVTVSES
jgi:cyclophilin family peptidyl-prolyl cis-trans isomerase